MSFFSRDSAEELARRIIEARINKNAEFELGLVIITDGQEKDAGTYRVHEVRESKPFHDLREVVYCKTVVTGRQIEIYMPPPSQRQIGVAEVIIDDSD